MRRDRCADVAGQVNRFDADIELVGDALGHGPNISANVRHLLRDGAPRTVGFFTVGKRDRLLRQVLVLGRPGDNELALVHSLADDHVLELDHRPGEIDLNPDLRAVAELRGADAQTDAALGH